MRCRVHVPVGGAHGHAEGVPDLAGAEHFVIPDEPRKNRESRGVCGCPSVRPPRIRGEIEERPRAAPPLRAVIENVVQLVQMPIVAVDDEQVAIARRSQINIAGLAALDPVGQRDRLVGNRVERKAGAGRVVHAVALARVLKDDRLLWRRPVDDDVRHPIVLHAARRHVAAKVGMDAAHRAVVDEADVGAGVRIERCGRDVGVPPVVGRKERQWTGKRSAEGGGGHEHGYTNWHDEQTNGQRSDEAAHDSPGAKAGPTGTGRKRGDFLPIRCRSAHEVADPSHCCWLSSSCVRAPIASCDIHGTNAGTSPGRAGCAAPTATATASSLRTALNPLNTPRVGGTSA